MDSIQAIQDEIIDEFSEIGDAFDQYSYLVEISAMLDPMPDEKKDKEHLVEGCQSHVWLYVSCVDGAIDIEADSDTYIVKGVLRLLEDMFNGQSPSDVASAEVTFLNKTQITATFDADRQKGIGYVIKDIQKQAAALA